MSKHKGGKLAAGAFIAAGIGYAVGILTAPKSGRETRKDLQRAAIKAKKESEQKLKSMHSKLSIQINKAKEKMNKASGSAQGELKKALTSAQSARDKARELLSALHEGEADNNELQRAINEIKMAAADLEKFIKSK